jgi:hypothetical protein
MWPEDWDKKQVENFFGFVAERQNIFHRRFVLRRQPPWSDDPILQKCRIANCYRELDRGTQFAIKNILSCEPFEDVFFNTVFYRLFNEPATFNVLGGFKAVGKFNAKRAAEILLERQAAHIKVFRPAWHVAGAGLHGAGAKVRSYCQAARAARVEKVRGPAQEVCRGADRNWRGLFISKARVKRTAGLIEIRCVPLEANSS